MNTEDIILEELREFRSQVQPWMMSTEHRLSTLESNCPKCHFENSSIEERLKGVERWHWKIAGAWGAVTALVGLVGMALKMLWPLASSHVK